MNFRNIFRRNNKQEEDKIYICSSCGESHKEWPAITFDCPDSYYALSDEFKKSNCHLSSDFCEVEHEDQTDRFIRVTMSQNIVDCDQTLKYGLWVSLSEKSFEDYKANFNREIDEKQYFGWLNNDLPEYEIGDPIPTTVLTKLGNIRPEIIPHETCDHQLVKDYYEGISKNEALVRIKRMEK